MSPEEQKELDRHKKAITKILKETRVGKAYPIGYAASWITPTIYAITKKTIDSDSWIYS